MLQLVILLVCFVNPVVFEAECTEIPSILLRKIGRSIFKKFNILIGTRQQFNPRYILPTQKHCSTKINIEINEFLIFFERG